MSWPVRRPSCRERQAPCLVVAAWPPAGPKVVQKGAPKGQQVGNGWATRERRRGGLPGTRRVRRGIYNGTDSGPKVATCCPFLYIIAGLYVLLRVMQYYYCRGAMLVRRGPQRGHRWAGNGPRGWAREKSTVFYKKRAFRSEGRRLILWSERQVAADGNEGSGRPAVADYGTFYA